jgi:TP901 family phage tail tape measure protein
MRSVNIGFNVKTSDAVTDLKKFQKELIKVQEIVTEINKSDIEPNVDSKYIKEYMTNIKNLSKEFETVKDKAKGVSESVEKIGKGSTSENPFIKTMRKQLLDLILVSDKLDSKMSSSGLSGIKNYKNEISSMLKDLSNKAISIGLDEKDIAKLKFNLKELKSSMSGSYKIFEINEKDLSKIDELKSKLGKLSEGNTFDLFGNTSNKINKLESELVDLQKRISNLGHGSDMPEFKSQIQGVEKELESLYKIQNPTGDFGGLSMLINKYTLLYGAINLAKESVRNFMELENVVYNLATASQTGAGGVSLLRSSLLDMATTSTFSAQQLGSAIDDVVRTGQTLADATKIVSATSMLATASGEGLGDAVSIVNKIFVALKISANDADKAVQSIHSTAILTSSSLESMGESAKQWIGAVSVFSTLTNKTGKDLNDYRLNLMRMGNTFTGILANMGRSGEASGTTIREFFTKIVQADKSAQEMLNSNLDRNKVYFKTNEDGIVQLTNNTQGAIKATAKSISDLAKQDVGQAIDLMSKMVKNGLVNSETLIKLFNGRYGLITQNMLREIDGDILGYAKKMEQTVKLTTDYELQLKNLNNQWSILKNNFADSSGAITNGFKHIGDMIGGTLNPLLQDANKNHKDLIQQVVVLGTSFVGMSLSVSIVSKALKLMKITTMTEAMSGLGGAMLGLANPIVLTTTAIIGLVSYMASLIMKQKEHDIQARINISTLQQTTMETLQLEKSYKNLNDTLDSIDYSSPMDATDAIRISMFNLTEQTKSLIEQITTLSNMKVTNPLESVQSAQFIQSKQTNANIMEKNITTATDKINDLIKNNPSFKKYQELLSQGKSVQAMLYGDMNISKVDLDSYKYWSDFLDNNKRGLANAKKELTNFMVQSKNTQLKTTDDTLKAYSEAFETSKSQLAKGYMDMLGNKNPKTMNEAIGFLNSMGGTASDVSKQLKTTYDSTIKGAFENLSSKQQKALLESGKVYDIMGEIEARNKSIEDLRKNTNPDLNVKNAQLITSLKEQNIQSLEGLKIEVEKTKKKEAEEKTLLNIIALSKEYELSQARVYELGQDSFTLAKLKLIETQKTYDLSREQELETLKQKGVQVGVNISDNNLSKVKSELEKAYSSFDPLKTKYTSIEKQRYSNIAEIINSIDKLQAEQYAHAKETNVAYYEMGKSLEAEKSYLNDVNTQFASLEDYQLKINDLKNESLKIGRTEEENYKAELESIQARYDYEMKMLKMKRDYLMDTYGLTMDNLESEKAKLLGIEGSGIKELSVSLGKPFATGGYTGSGGKYEPAGVVHKNELKYRLIKNYVNCWNPLRA